MRVRIRQFDLLLPFTKRERAGRSWLGDAVWALLLALASIAGFTRSLPTEARRSGMASAYPHRDPIPTDPSYRSGLRRSPDYYALG
jgi:hypothetical protein